ncbi:hypothetical protein K502DRAFT_363230 [Neoconidiobolus thromboides FSU 785]|nr:hypothetical protein K502DRAFT_363230 [Neoconidiobolus thromboides FSU 785]
MNPNNSNNNPFYTPLDDDEVNPFQTMNSNPFYQNSHNNNQQQSNQRNTINDAFSGNEGLSNDLMPQRVKEENHNQNQTNASGFETNFNDGLTVNNNIINNDDVHSEALRNLKEICPTIDTEVLELILQNNDNNLEKSINEALTLSDPSYVPPTTVSHQDNTQQISDEQLARSIQEEENRVNKFHQTQNDEAYARAILAAEQQYVNDIRQQREDSRQRNERIDRNERGESESDNNISKILESTKKKFMGLFKSKSEEDNYHRPLNDDQSVHSELSHNNPNTTSTLRNNNNNQQYNLQNEVTLERRDNPNINNRYNNNNNNLLNDDISEDMIPIKPISHLNNEGNYYNQNNNFNINDPVRSVSPSTNKNKSLNTSGNNNQDLFESNVVFEENHNNYNNNNNNNNPNITTSNSNIVSQDQVEFDSNPFLNSDDFKNRKKSNFH